MALTFSSGLKGAWLGNAVAEDSLLNVLNTNGGGGVPFEAAGVDIYIMKGTKPTSPDTGAGATDDLVKIKNAAAGGLFEWLGTPSFWLTIKTAEVWSGTAGANASTGLEATWFRLCKTGASIISTSAALIRIDGTCGDTGTEDLVLSDATIANGDVKTIDVFRIKLP